MSEERNSADTYKGMDILRSILLLTLAITVMCCCSSNSNQIDLSMLEPKKSIEQLPGMNVKGKYGERTIDFDSPISHEDLLKLIQILREHEAGISFYDQEYPSPSDPGAYFDYGLRESTPKHWSMSLGNHGWTGGVYQIDEPTIACQIGNLINKGLLKSLDFEDITLFHYEVEKESKSTEMIERLRSIHKFSQNQAVEVNSVR